MEELETRRTIAADVSRCVREGKPDLRTRFQVSPLNETRTEGNIQVSWRLKSLRYSNIELEGTSLLLLILAEFELW
jgi:hypothetical protein